MFSFEGNPCSYGSIMYYIKLKTCDSISKLPSESAPHAQPYQHVEDIPARGYNWNFVDLSRRAIIAAFLRTLLLRLSTGCSSIFEGDTLLRSPKSLGPERNLNCRAEHVDMAAELQIAGTSLHNLRDAVFKEKVLVGCLTPKLTTKIVRLISKNETFSYFNVAAALFAVSRQLMEWKLKMRHYFCVAPSSNPVSLSAAGSSVSSEKRSRSICFISGDQSSRRRTATYRAALNRCSLGSRNMSPSRITHPIFVSHKCGCTEPASCFVIHRHIDQPVLGNLDHCSSIISVRDQNYCSNSYGNWKL